MWNLPIQPGWNWQDQAVQSFHSTLSTNESCSSCSATVYAGITSSNSLSLGFSFPSSNKSSVASNKPIPYCVVINFSCARWWLLFYSDFVITAWDPDFSSSESRFPASQTLNPVSQTSISVISVSQQTQISTSVTPPKMSCGIPVDHSTPISSQSGVQNPVV